MGSCATLAKREMKNGQTLDDTCAAGLELLGVDGAGAVRIEQVEPGADFHIGFIAMLLARKLT